MALANMARPKTDAEKRDAYHRDLLAQIEQADAMDERLRAKQRKYAASIGGRSNGQGKGREARHIPSRTFCLARINKSPAS